MVNVNDVKRLLDLISNKNQNGQITTDRFNIAAKAVSIMWLNANIGEPNIQRNGMSANDMFYESDRKITDNLLHLVTPQSLGINSQGRALLPQNFSYTSSVRYKISDLQIDGTYKVREVKVDPVDDGQLSERLNSEMLYPTNEYPIYNIKNGYLQVYPYTKGHLIYTYIRLPQIPVWAYTIVNGAQVYDPTTSVDFDYPDDNLNEISFRMCGYLGINISNQLLLSYTNQMITQGS